jgi:AcrR family transcriptional regulator
MPASKATYHHGDLRAACVSTAMELLEESGETALSLRAVARRAGVSPGDLRAMTTEQPQTRAN